MKLCIRAHDLFENNADDLANHIKNSGFCGAQLALAKSFKGLDVLSELSKPVIRDTAKAFASRGLEVAMLASYFNPVHSNSELVETNIKKFKWHLAHAGEFGCKYVGTETGSYNDDKWTYHPLNRTEEAYARIRAIFADLAETAKLHGSNLALEGAFGHCCYEPRVLKRLVDEIDNGHVFVTVDLFNYLDISNFSRQREIFDECIELFADRIVIFHIKDCRAVDGELVRVPIGTGEMDFDYILPKMLRFSDARLIFEGEQEPHIANSVRYIKRFDG